MTDNLPATFPAGHVPTGGEMQAILDEIRAMRLYAKKTVDESVISNIVPQNDDQLFMSVEANSTYKFFCNIIYGGATASEIQLNFTAPAAATAAWTSHSLGIGATTFEGDIKMEYRDLTATATVGTVTGSILVFKGSGTLWTAGTAGTFRLVWAQATSTASNTTVYANSDLHLMKVA